MKINVVCRPNDLAERLGIKLINYKQAVDLAFDVINQNRVISSWKDSFSASQASQSMMQQVDVPEYGIFRDLKWRPIPNNSAPVINKIWSIGGDNGWYYGNWLWKIRGGIDKLVGGVGLRRGRRNQNELHPGDALDFWRVLVADKENKRLLLFAEMKVPGEAWLEWKVIKRKEKEFLRQTATFRPRGLWGRIYWYSVLPFHYFIFNGMIDEIIRGD